jgi:hypothetical protein
MIDAHDRAIEERILKSFRFVNGTDSTSSPGVSQLVYLTEPQANALVTSPLTIHGEARGMWYFEASFPVVLTDWDGKIIAEGHADAQSDWMTEDFVPFTAILTFTKPAYGERGTLVLKKDNPSGLPEHYAALEIPVRFR